MEPAPTRHLREGRALLASIVEAHGFQWRQGASGSSSGGTFDSGEYVRGDRRLELHFRFSLGMVTYHIGELSLSHEELMRHTGHRPDSKYPGFSSEPIDAFRGLAEDLSRFCGDFLSGPGAEFRVAHGASKTFANQSGFARLGKQ